MRKKIHKEPKSKTPTVYKFDTEKSKNRKKDEEKVEIVHKIAEFMQTFVQNAEIVNEGQKISFENGVLYGNGNILEEEVEKTITTLSNIKQIIYFSFIFLNFISS